MTGWTDFEDMVGLRLLTGNHRGLARLFLQLSVAQFLNLRAIRFHNDFLRQEVRHHQATRRSYAFQKLYRGLEFLPLRQTLYGGMELNKLLASVTPVIFATQFRLHITPSGKNGENWAEFHVYKGCQWRLPAPQN